MSRGHDGSPLDEQRDRRAFIASATTAVGVAALLATLSVSRAAGVLDARADVTVGQRSATC